MFQADIHRIYLEDHKSKWSYKSEEEAQMIMIEIKDRTQIDIHKIKENIAVIGTMTTVEMEVEEETTITMVVITEEEMEVEMAAVVVVVATETEEITIIVTVVTIEVIKTTITITTIEITTIIAKMTIKIKEVDLDRIKGSSSSTAKKVGNLNILWVVVKHHNSNIRTCSISSNNLRCFSSNL